MFTRRRLPALLFAGALFAAIPTLANAADRPDPKTVAEMTRYLKAIRFGETFLGGVRKANSAEGQGSVFLDRVLQATPDEIEVTVAPAFAADVSLKEARAMADFFSSPVGQKAIAQGQGKPGGPGSGQPLTAAETSALEKFGNTSAGKRAVTLTTDPAVRQRYFVLLKEKYGQ